MPKPSSLLGTISNTTLTHAKPLGCQEIHSSMVPYGRVKEILNLNNCSSDKIAMERNTILQCTCNMSEAQTFTDDSEWMRNNCDIDGL